jgi:hypothetical protein
MIYFLLHFFKVVFNNELLSNIKNLETIIKKQLEEQNRSNMVSQSPVAAAADLLNDQEPIVLQKTEPEVSRLESMQHDLTNMKSEFVESALNRQVAIAQIRMESGVETNHQDQSIVLDDNKDSGVDEVLILICLWRGSSKI